MKYEIIFAPEAEDDLDDLRAYDRSKILEAIEVHLSYEPEKTSKSRIKRLRQMKQPQYRLRVDNMRVFYDVIYIASDGIVEIIAVGEKSEAMKWLAEYGVESE